MTAARDFLSVLKMRHLCHGILKKVALTVFTMLKRNAQSGFFTHGLDERDTMVMLFFFTFTKKKRETKNQKTLFFISLHLDSELIWWIKSDKTLPWALHWLSKFFASALSVNILQISSIFVKDLFLENLPFSTCVCYILDLNKHNFSFFRACLGPSNVLPLDARFLRSQGDVTNLPATIRPFSVGPGRWPHAV